MMKISIVIPNYNGENLLRKNLPKVIEATENLVAEIIVVDDASTDKSVESIKYYASSIKNLNIELKIIENKNNLGFSSTVNKGVKEATGDVVVLLNTDVVPEKGFLNPIIEDFKDSDVFAVGCLDKSIEGLKTILRGRGLGVWKRGFLVHRRGEVDKNNTLWVSGGSGAFRKSIWEKLGGFNELYNPFYWEDIDLSYKAQKCGYKILFELKSVVVHEHEKGAIKSKFTSSKIKSISYKNQFIFVWLNATDFDIIFFHLIALPYYFLKSLIHRDWPFFLGFFEAFVFLPKIVQSAIKNQKLFIKGDKEIIQEFK